MPANKSTVNIRSTDRGGAVTLVAGILSLSIGFGLLIGITLQTTAHTVVMFKEMALGLAGALYSFIPFVFIWMGWLLCVSARHYISFRSFTIMLMLYAALLALLTMLTSVTGFGTLMQYIRSVNMNVRQISQPDSYGEYLVRAYNRYNNQLNPLPGGGALGMLVAFPVWKILGQVGGVIFLIISMLVLLFALLRINPVLIYQKFESFLQGGAQKRPQSVQPQQDAAKAFETAQRPEQSSAGADAGSVPYQPQTEPYYVDPQSEPFVSAQPGSFVPPEEVYAQTAWQQPAACKERPEDQGFTPVEQDFYERLDPVPPAAVKTRRSVCHEQAASARPAEPAAAPAPVTQAVASSESAKAEKREPSSSPVQEKPMAAHRGEAQQAGMAAPHSPSVESVNHTAEPNEVPARTKPVEPVYHPSYEAYAGPETDPVIEPQRVERETRQERTISPRSIISSGRINEVGVASAVPLTGQRISVKPTAAALQETRLDGTAAPKPVVKQTSMQLDDYQKPALRLISLPPPDANHDTTEEDTARAEKLISTLASFNIAATVNQVVHGPAVTSFGIRLAEGVNINKLRNVMDNISVELLAKSPARAEIPIPGTPLIGIEVSNEKASMVYLSEILDSPKMKELKSPTAVALGKDIYGSPVICELMDMPHLLIAGATGSGKSVCINSIITSLLYRSSPRDVRLILIDPKFVELQPYNDGPHLLLPVLVDPKKAVMALEWVCQEMDERYKRLEKRRVRNIDAYNAKLEPDEEPMPRIIVIVDEMADLMLTAGKAIDEHIKRITAKARAAGICLILATQRPSVDVITGIIKANIPSRIAFQVSSQIDSRTILDSQGAEKLLGYGDMLYFPRTLKAPKRVQGCFISDADVASVADYVKSHNQTEYNSDIMEHIEKEEKKESGGGQNGGGGGEEEDDSFDELLPKAIEMAVEAGQMSISMLQRVLRVGYGRAGRLIDEMARRNIISGNEGTKPRKTLITREEYQQLFEDEAPF